MATSIALDSTSVVPVDSAPPLRQEKDPRYFAKMTVMGLVLAAAMVPVMWMLAFRPETPVSRAEWILLTISAIANVAVITFHYMVPAHPKFLMLPGRRAVLLIHIVSGSVELVAGLFACFAHSHNAAIIQACAALFFHVPSAFAQVRIVFGSKAIMYPAYVLSISLHGFCAAMLLWHPDSQMWAVNTFLVFNIYTWCRIYFFVFDWMKLFASMKYTISIFAAGVTMLPGLLGSMTMLVLTGFVLLYIFLQKLLFIRTPAEYSDFVREKSREGTVGPDMSAFWSGLVRRESDERVARSYFDGLARDAQGHVTPAELHRTLAPWGLRAQEIRNFADRLLAAGPLTFERFLESVWSIGAVRSQAIQIVMTDQAASERDKAELVFRYADRNRDGFLTATDLEVLLTEWGLPAGEASAYLAHADRDGDGQISFDDFLQRMRPFWRFIFFEVFRAQLDRKNTNDLVGRSATAIRDRLRTKGLRRRVEHELLSHVPFLAGATPELLDDLSASMVEMNIRAGDVLFAEGVAGDAFFIVGTGLISVTKGGKAIAELGTGGCVGEGALLSDEPRSATVTAVSDTSIFSLNRSSFQFLTEKYPEVRDRLRDLHVTRQVASRARTIQEELVEQIPFLSAAKPELIHDLAANLTTLRVQPGEVVVREGEPGDSFYIVEKGATQVSRGGKPLAKLGPGGCFGEGALFSGEARSATVLATEGTRLFQLKRDAFNTILSHHPDVKRDLLQLHSSRTNDPFLPQA